MLQVENFVLHVCHCGGHHSSETRREGRIERDKGMWRGRTPGKTGTGRGRQTRERETKEWRQTRRETDTHRREKGKVERERG